MMKSYKIWLAAFVLALAGCAPKAVFDPSPAASTAYYQSTPHIALEHVLPPPPAIGSQQDIDDMAEVVRLQEMRTPAQQQEAIMDAELTPLRFQSVMGAKFTPENLPKTFAFFERVKKDEEVIIHKTKESYSRTRPYLRNLEVKPIVPQPNNSSYPSGHTSYGHVMGLLLAEMMSEKRVAIEMRAESYGNNRVIAGVHYPSDVAAGKMAAQAIVEQWMHDPEFMTEFNAAKEELRSKL